MTFPRRAASHSSTVLKKSTFVSKANATLLVRSEAEVATYYKYTHGTRARKGAKDATGNLCGRDAPSSVSRSAKRARARRLGWLAGWLEWLIVFVTKRAPNANAYGPNNRLF